MEAYPAWTPHYISTQLTIHQMIVLSKPEGRISAEQAIDCINERNARLGKPMIHEIS